MRTLVLSFILTCSSSTVLAQMPPAPKPDAALPFALKPLGHGIYAAIDNPKGESGANAGFVVGDDGIAVIDTFENEPAAKALLGEIRMVSKLPIKFVINTHYHLDHVAGNGVFAKEGAVIVAHRNVPAWIHTENLKFFGKDITAEQKSLVENLAAPTCSMIPKPSFASALSLSMSSIFPATPEAIPSSSCSRKNPQSFSAATFSGITLFPISSTRQLFPGSKLCPHSLNSPPSPPSSSSQDTAIQVTPPTSPHSAAT